MSKLCVKVDHDLCQGHGVCEAEASEVFRLEETDAPYPQSVVILENPPEDYREKVKKAERFCPNSAIIVTDQD